ncbi:SDR family oxidoreductase [Dysgonomonas sp. ZJ709]|uniref:SDR family oxidoreductase n=1 Tax=Dysgonomonas sp. ZJ709 TaxID=2709797 RepID=UPI0013EDE6A5|nr:SDR family oxidoreductase [Dysgonomonas sp. ZJ709]
MKKTALILGGNGIIGCNIASYLEDSNEWNLIISSHSPLTYSSRADFVRLDLTDPDAVEKQREKLKNVTHIFFGAYIEKGNLAEQTTVNTLLLKNLITGIEKVAPNFEHSTFIQGGKAYGAHLGMYKTPAKETDSRHFPPNFYYDQEDFLRQQSADKNWNWTALRPDMIVGMAIGNPMNLATLIAVYATLCKELNVSMRFPGNEKAYHVLVNVTDAQLLAKGMEYVSLHESCQNGIFNITNGDIFRWKEVWPKIGEYFGVPVDEPQTFSLAAYMKDKDALWQEIVNKYKLENHKFDRLVQWPFGDFIFNNVYDAFFDVSKLRRHGFHEMQTDSFESFKRVFDQLKEYKIIPA